MSSVRITLPTVSAESNRTLWWLTLSSGLNAGLQNGVSQYPKLEGRFPCVAGIQMTFDASKPGGSRIDVASVKVKVRGTGEFAALDMEKEYAVATKAYLALGKDGYDVFPKARLIADSGVPSEAAGDSCAWAWG